MLLVLCCTIFFVALSEVCGWAEESDQRRWYFALRYGESAPFSRAHDSVGFTFGANLNRYVGLELAMDSYEIFVTPPGLGDIGELGVMTFIPQLRLRYPLLNDRLVPYAIAGVGVALTQFNDPKQDGLSLTVDGSIGSVLTGTVGAGIEYFIADNIAVGAEGKYMISNMRTLEIQGHDPFRLNVNAALATIQLRLFFPELHPPASFAESGEPTAKRFYIGLRAGGAIPTQSQPFGGIQYMAEPPAYFNTLNQYFGAMLGYNFDRHWGLELAAEGFEIRLSQTGKSGALGEYAVHAFTLQPRYRFPMLNGRLQPYVIAGAGLGFAQFNDRNPGGENVQIAAENYSAVGTVGTGVDYFVLSNIALNFETKYLIARGFTAQINNGPTQKGNLDTVLLSLGIRMFLF
jgi:opacity protein-like surface antigen